MRVPARRILYREDAPATWLYFCREGAVKTYRDLPSGTRRVTAFLFPDDVFGLAQSGRYVNTAQAIAPTWCFRVAVDPLRAVLQQDAVLEYHFLCKVAHELRESQRRAIIMGRRHAAGRLAMLLVMLRSHLPPGKERDVISLPMSRSDIAGYLGLSLESVSRAAAELVKRGLVTFEGPHAVRVLAPARLDQLAADV